MKKWLFIFPFVFMTSHLFCQNLKWEIINAGLAFGFSEDKSGYRNENDGALTFGTGIRYNLPGLSLSPGFDFTFSGWNRVAPAPLASSYHQNAFVFLLTTDYNYTKISPKFIPFGGLGVGGALMRDWGDNIDGISYYPKFAVSPRVGFEFLKNLRFTTEYMCLGNGNNFFNFKLGFVKSF